MRFEDLERRLFSGLGDRLREGSIDIFVSNRAKFEGWLKVEVAGILADCGCTVIPEKDRVDITADEWMLELKTCNTNYRYPGVVSKTRPVTMNVSEIIADAESLSKTDGARKAVLFVAFPLEHRNRKWQEIHMPKISAAVGQIRHIQLHTSGGIPLVVYLAEVGQPPARGHLTRHESAGDVWDL